MGLTIEFSNNVLHAIKAREAKAQKIADGIKGFIDWGVRSHASFPVPDLERLQASGHTPTFAPKDDDMTTDAENYFVIYESRVNGRNESTLLIAVESSGEIRINLTGDEFGSGHQCTFNFDNYKPEDAVAKIVTIIQNEDINGFGPLLTETAKRIWTQALGNKSTEAPGVVPAGPSPSN